jgi:hypothetical protein
MILETFPNLVDAQLSRNKQESLYLISVYISKNLSVFGFSVLDYPLISKGGLAGAQDRGHMRCGTQGITSETDLFPANPILPWTGPTP